ncbi:WecB/TagA/CpsF family glycosyltransferase [Priestia aryabhattai]|uniref:WecB/TagA/CpsF family glycosyltransferase n=1 Tax=Priestia aryabhattai TaxID=412384 RepID=UPI0015F3E2D0|nr:WecB/TagA/CpsF family glycosyltransferase [Priestia aryabhattai]
MKESIDESLINSKTINDEKIFNRLVNKKEIPICNVLGVNIAAINMEWLLSYLKENIKSGNGNELAGDYICVSNVHTTVLSYEDAQYCSIQNNGLMAIPDGGPLSTIGRKLGHKNIARITGPSLMDELFKVSTESGYRHYFYGSTDATLEKLREELEKKYAGIHIAGMYSPPFRALTTEEDLEVINRINEAKPDFIWVGLGAPKQERWMAEHQGKINGLMIGVGAGFDYHANNISRAPQWMQQNNLEWFYRLLQDPKRLFKRYLYTNSKFVWLILTGAKVKSYRKKGGRGYGEKTKSSNGS